jgi:transposase
MAVENCRMEAMTMGERRRVLALYEKGWTTRRIAEALGRSVAGVRRIRQRFRQRGRLEPDKRGDGRPPKVTAADRAALAKQVAQKPDVTLNELHAQCGLAVSRSTIDRHLRILKLTFKKK